MTDERMAEIVALREAIGNHNWTTGGCLGDEWESSGEGIFSDDPRMKRRLVVVAPDTSYRWDQDLDTDIIAFLCETPKIVDELLADNERLRRALTEIRDGFNTDEIRYFTSVQDAFDTAREAVGNKPKE